MPFSKAVIIGLVVLLSGFLSILYSQTPGAATTQPAAGNQPTGQPTTQPVSNIQPTKTDTGPVRAIQLQDFDPIAVKDPRFVISNVNFVRRYAPNGVGEFLDVVFDIRNLTSEYVEFYAYILGYWETDAVDRNSRRLIPYPSWRVNDPARTQFLVHYITVTPKDIPDSEIWSDKDPDYAHYSHIITEMRNSVATTEPLSDVRPPFWKYLSYVSQRPSQGLKFRLFGDVGPGQHEVIQSNYIAPTAEEKKLKIHKTLPQHKYTIENNRRFTVFRSHHYSPYRADFKYFNMVSVLLFDAKKAEAFEEQNKAGGAKPGEKVDPLVYKQTFRIAYNLKL